MPEIDELPQNSAQLATLAADEQQPLSRRQAALAELRPVIHRLARLVANVLAGQQQVAHDLLDEAVTYIWERLSKFDGSRSFEAWCRSVLQHRLIDLYRYRKRDLLHQARPIEDRTKTQPQLACSWQKQLERAGQESDSFSTLDLKRICQWKLADRIFLLTATGLWTKVPTTDWNSWIRDGNYEEPFPPPELSLHEDVAERVAVLADLWHTRRNTLAQRWHRKKELLLKLDYIRRLGEGE